jgi:hypothetical protein
LDIASKKPIKIIIIPDKINNFPALLKISIEKILI